MKRSHYHIENKTENFKHTMSNMAMFLIDEDYAKNILKQLWLQEEFCDVVLIAGAEELRIPAHRNILAIASDYFKDIFTSAMYKKIWTEIKLPTIPSAILQSLIEYIYTGRLKIMEYNVVELFKASCMLSLHKITKACANFLEATLNPANCLATLMLAEQCHCQELIQKSKSFCLEHFKDVCDTEGFLNVNAKQLSEILASDDLCVRSEEDVFYNLIKWIQHDSSEREKYLAQMLKLVRLPLLELSFLKNKVRPICSSNDCIQLYMDTLETKLSPSYRFYKRNEHSFVMALATNDKHNLMLHYFCPQQFKWMKCFKGLEYRRMYGVGVIENNLYIVGGRDALENDLNTAVCLNLKTMILTEINSMTESRPGCRAAVLDGSLYAVGGLNLKSVEKWNPMTQAWCKVASMSTRRCDFGIEVFQGKLYVIGGLSDDGALSSAECYDPQMNIWKSIRSMNESRICPGLAVANNLIYAVGGWRDTKSVERYDPQTNSWTMLCCLREKLYGLQSCTSFRNQVLVCYRDRIEEYSAESNEWVVSETSNSVECIFSLFSYSGKLLTTEFA